VLAIGAGTCLQRRTMDTDFVLRLQGLLEGLGRTSLASHRFENP
jgi:hypothetical protein